jgi:hypothetical protein
VPPRATLQPPRQEQPWDAKQSIEQSLELDWRIIAQIAWLLGIYWDVNGELPKRNPKRIF